MPAVVYVAYSRPANGGDFKFDMNYYVNHHMNGLVTKAWSNRGLQAWTVTDHRDDKTQPHAVIASLTWPDLDTWEAVYAEQETQTVVFGDIPNFTDIEPVVFKGSVTASWNKM